MRSIWLLILLCLPALIPAQQHTFRHFTPDDGLPSWRTYTVVQDQWGFINILTEMGIARYDGNEFVVFNAKNGLPFNDIWDMFADTITGRLWFCTFGPALWYYDLKVDNLGKINLPGIRDKIDNIAINEQGEIYLFSNGIHRMKEGTTELLLPITESINFASFRNGFLMFFDSDTIVDVFGGAEKFRFAQLGNVPGWIPKFTIVENRQRVWCYTSDSIYLLDGEKVSKTPAPWLKRHDLRSIHYFNENGLTLMAGVGVAILMRGDRLLGTYYTPPGIEIVKGNLDKEGNMWLASANSGVYFFPAHGSGALHYAGETHPQIQALGCDGMNRTWFADGSGGLFFIENQKKQNVDISFPDGSMLDGKIYQITTWGKYLVVVSQYKGLVFLRIPPDWQGSTIKVGHVFDDMYDFGNNLLGLSSGNFAIRRHGTFKSVFPSRGTPNLFATTAYGTYEIEWMRDDLLRFKLVTNGRAYAVAEDAGGAVWVGQPDGLFKWENGSADSLNALKAHYPMLRNNINSLAFDEHQTLWVGTDGGGFAISQGRVYPFRHDFLRASVVQHVFVDGKDRVWLATDRGIQCLLVTDRENLQWLVLYYNLDDGLSSPGTNQVYVRGDTVFAATDKGVSQLMYESGKQDYPPPLISIWRAEKSGQHWAVFKKDEKLPLHENFIRFHFLATAFKCQNEVQFYYKLDVNGTYGKDVAVGNQTSVALPNLGSGTYTFHVWVKDCNGMISKPDTYTFSIAYPLVLRWWFLATAAILLAFGIWRWIQAIRKREQEKTAINKKFAELELQALQSQMNPHFLFNAMQAIQLFIAKNDTVQANIYLANFAKLMRMFLEASRQRYISLNDELEILRLYVELEKMRFGEKFDYRIVFPQENSTGNVPVPSHLLQPFVENAINHGIRYKQGKGFLLVEVQRPESRLLSIKIEDNGVGRQKAREMKQLSGAYRSRGLEIIADYLQTLEWADGVNVQIITQDLKDDEGNPAGTRVEIKLWQAE